MKSVKNGEKNTTDYLLMLAAALIIVAIAVYYVMVIGSKTISVEVGLTTDNTVWLRGEPGCVVVADWNFKYQKSGDDNWSENVIDIGPNKEIQLTGLTNRVGVGDNVVIKYNNTTKTLVVQQY
jgi:hypothetical protein